MRKILVVTGTRAEYGLLYWTMKEIKKDKDLQLQLIVTGNHLIREYGYTVGQIKKDGFKIDEEIDMIIDSEKKSSVLKSMGIEMIQMAQAFDRLKPDILLILGDRYETFIAATCAMMMNIPIAHMNGGESTEGAVDEQIRHAITKMAHIHFPGAAYYKERIIKMGEEPWRVFNVGQAGIENIKKLKLLGKEQLEKELNINFTKKVFLITYHPVTLQLKNTKGQIDNLLKAISNFDAQYIFTYPNADFGSKIIIDKINDFVKDHKEAKIYYSLGQKRYLNLLKYADIMIGNSSSGIIESPIFKIPVVNIGDRQKGRVRNKNIIDTDYSENEITNAISKVLKDEKFKENLNSIDNIYGNGNTSKQIVEILKSIAINKKLLSKRLSY
ncbi:MULTISPECIES: UDP-N-acetylglucosamine 2-epimerase [Clostridium]|uniref:UDP-N-acetylglucosamine 2-epimerase n=2 Tax=Clostridium TaxID=1485 RepID=A0A0D1AN08_CLOBO|nr:MULTISPECIES: UDP-N-acetylglucosamine 2-epimerase [Clostridium]MDU2832809.1 UDP-N-acetylglucosamine 2-epimerase [Clostridium botulinum]KIS24519.1 UDP-N-acetylglucosamine 2-epimerase [Clostridium botulinum B2 450]MDU4547857.1 UDP-N-acetylglucosamine 2-epimerase [Clostridium botulinum]MDU5012692.1 UDP-N-acetylglucosamine 2-epimerase [Clostridium botulinum]MDU5118384.1 UDP-N-acetylglucosamine 2-epimerase [Clostridium botulinum]